MSAHSTDKLQSKAGKVVMEKTVTPARAAELLAKLHPGQRSLRERHVDAIARALSKGEYAWTADPIRFDSKGHLIDGQHRLAACVKSGVPLTNVLIATIYDPASIKFIDTGSAPRSLRDIRQIQGQAQVNNTIIAAVAFEFADFAAHEVVQLTKVERNELVESCEHLEALIRLRSAGAKLSVTAGVLAGALRCLRSNAAAAERFFMAAFTNSPLLDGEVSMQSKLLADFMIADASKRRGSLGRGSIRVDNFEGAYKAVRAYNAWRRGERIDKLQRPKDNAMLKVVA